MVVDATGVTRDVEVGDERLEVQRLPAPGDDVLGGMIVPCTTTQFDAGLEHNVGVNSSACCRLTRGGGHPVHGSGKRPARAIPYRSALSAGAAGIGSQHSGPGRFSATSRNGDLCVGIGVPRPQALAVGRRAHRVGRVRSRCPATHGASVGWDRIGAAKR